MNTFMFENLSDWTRSRYYEHLSLLDLLAKSFGECNVFQKTILYISSFSPCLFFYIHPVFLVSGCLLSGFLLLLNIQYCAMENRFTTMLVDIKRCEHELANSMDACLTLKAKIFELSEKNKVVANQLESSQEQVHHIHQQFLEHQAKANEAMRTIVQAVEQTNRLSNDFKTTLGVSIEKTKHLISVFDETSKLLSNCTSEPHGDFQLDAIIAFRTKIEAELLLQYGNQYLDFKNKANPYASVTCC